MFSSKVFHYLTDLLYLILKLTFHLIADDSLRRPSPCSSALQVCSTPPKEALLSTKTALYRSLQVTPQLCQVELAVASKEINFFTPRLRKQDFENSKC